MKKPTNPSKVIIAPNPPKPKQEGDAPAAAPVVGPKDAPAAPPKTEKPAEEADEEETE